VDRVAIFDLDNTLVDRQAAFERFAGRFARGHGLGRDATYWLIAADEDGFSNRRTMFELAKSHFGLPLSVDELLSAYYADYLAGFTPDPAVQAALRRLKEAGWRVAIATNGPSTQRAKIDGAGLSPWLDAICISGELGFAKPDRRIFEAACLRAGLDLEALPASWMVGDTAAADIRGAVDAGLRSIWLSRGRQWTEVGFAPEVIVATIPEAVDHLLAGV
jgi:putative hydrolase of the HAD superfamily